MRHRGLSTRNMCCPCVGLNLVRVGEHVEGDPGLFFVRAARSVLGARINRHADFVVALVLPRAVVRTARDPARLAMHMVGMTYAPVCQKERKKLSRQRDRLSGDPRNTTKAGNESLCWWHAPFYFVCSWISTLKNIRLDETWSRRAFFLATSMASLMCLARNKAAASASAAARRVAAVASSSHA